MLKTFNISIVYMKTLFYTLIFLQLFSLSHAQSSIKVKVVGRSKTVSKETIPLTLSDTLSYLKKLSKQRPYEDLNYDYGSEFIPSPRKGALGWQDNNGNFWIFGGIGIDDDYNTGLFQDLWTFNPLKSAWTLVKGDRKVIVEKDFTSKEIPLPRRDAMTWVDKNGDLWLYGGRDFGDNLHYGDMWKFTLKTKTWSNTAGTKEFNKKSSRTGIKKSSKDDTPGGRSLSSTWNDTDGNLWLFGGTGIKDLGQNAFYNDLWLFDPKKGQWTWVSGSSLQNVKTNNSQKNKEDNNQQPSPRMKALTWYDRLNNQLWLYGGYGVDSTGNQSGGLSDMWYYDIKKDTWVWVSGTLKLFESPEYGMFNREIEQSHPGFRFGSVSWTDKEGDLWLFGGHNSTSGEHISIDANLWRFNRKNKRWANAINQFSIDLIEDNCSFEDSEGNIFLFGGQQWDTYKNQTRPTNDIWKITTK